MLKRLLHCDFPASLVTTSRLQNTVHARARQNIKYRAGFEARSLITFTSLFAVMRGPPVDPIPIWMQLPTVEPRCFKAWSSGIDKSAPQNQSHFGRQMSTEPPDPHSRTVHTCVRPEDVLGFRLALGRPHRSSLEECVMFKLGQYQRFVNFWTLPASLTIIMSSLLPTITLRTQQPQIMREFGGLEVATPEDDQRTQWVRKKGQCCIPRDEP